MARTSLAHYNTEFGIWQPGENGGLLLWEEQAEACVKMRSSPALMAALDKAEAERATLIEQMADANNQIAAATVTCPLV